MPHRRHAEAEGKPFYLVSRVSKEAVIPGSLVGIIDVPRLAVGSGTVIPHIAYPAKL